VVTAKKRGLVREIFALGEIERVVLQGTRKRDFATKEGKDFFITKRLQKTCSRFEGGGRAGHAERRRGDLSTSVQGGEKAYRIRLVRVGQSQKIKREALRQRIPFTLVFVSGGGPK